MNKVVILVLALLGGTWLVSTMFKGLGPGPDKVFSALVGDPSEVEGIDGFVRRGDAYDVHLRFRAEDDFIHSLVYRGFRPADCAAVLDMIRFSPMRLAIWPLWLPSRIETPACFRRVGRNDWSPRARDWILAEEGGGWVYFHGKGREYDRNMNERRDPTR